MLSPRRDASPGPPPLSQKWKLLKRSLSPNNARNALAFHENAGHLHLNNEDLDQSKQWIHPDGQLIEEMTEEQEQEIYEIPNSELSHRLQSKRGLLQRIASIRNNNPNGHNISRSHSSSSLPTGSDAQNNNTTSSGRLQSSYKLLEEEYCKLKFEQTELVALADQRKMEKARSAELLESLDEEIRTRRTINLNLRLDKEKLQQEVEGMPRQSSQHNEKESNHELNSLWLQRDLADHKLQEARDKLYALRKESKQFLDELQTPPIISEEVVRQEQSRLRKEARVNGGILEDQLEQLKRELLRLRPAPKHHQSQESRIDANIIGKEILVGDEDSAKDTVSVTSTLLSDGNKT
jgi:hypothetical protein